MGQLANLTNIHEIESYGILIGEERFICQFTNKCSNNSVTASSVISGQNKHTADHLIA